MRIYHYNPTTGEYTGSTDAILDPLELEINKREIYLLPALATFDPAPPTEEGKIIVMEDGRWTQVDIPVSPTKLEPVLPTVEELAARELEVLIRSKIREIAITALIAEGTLTEDNEIKNKVN